MTPNPTAVDGERLVELAARCEAALRQDDAIDLAIADWCYRNGKLGINYEPSLWLERNCWEPTGSLDSAMTLVPVGAQMQFQNFGDTGGRSMRLVAPNERFVSAATPALALCSAALRARAHPSIDRKDEG